MTLAEILRDLPAAVVEARPEDLPALCGRLREAELLCEVRLHTAEHEPTTAEQDRLLDMPEVAQRLGVPEDRAYELGRRGLLPVVVIGKYRRVRLSALSAFIAANEQKALDGHLYSGYSSQHARLRAAGKTAADAADSSGAGRASGCRQQHRGAVGARRGADHRDDCTVRQVAGEVRPAESPGAQE
jgi:hypothetical protein